MKQNYSSPFNYTYISPFGEEFATVTWKSVARSRDSIHNLRLERREYADRVSALQADISNLKAANKYMRRHALSKYEQLKAENERLREEATHWRTIAELTMIREKALLMKKE